MTVLWGAECTPAFFPPVWPFGGGSSYGITSNTMTAANHIIVATGPVVWSTRDTRNAAKVHWFTGATMTAVATLRLSLQNVATATGRPARGDGTVDQSYSSSTIPGASTWTVTTLDAARTMATGDLVAVVWEYTAYTSGTVSVSSANIAAATQNNNLAPISKSSDGGTTYSQLTGVPIIVFESDDATPVYGTIMGGALHYAVNSHALATNTDPKAIATKITLPDDMDIIGIWMMLTTGSALADFNLILMADDFSTIESVSVDSQQLTGGVAGRIIEVPLLTKRSKSAGDVVYVACVPTSTTAVTMTSLDYYDAAFKDFDPAGQLRGCASLSSADAWSDSATTRSLVGGIIFNAVGSSGGATGVYRGMTRRHGV